jgi:hypothetical protein
MSAGASVRGLLVMRLATVAILVVVGQVGVVLIASTRAEGMECLNEQIRREGTYTSKLPDCRAYEQVSPVNKNATDAAGALGIVQSSPSGERVTFFSVLPFPEVPGASEFPTYLSTRGDERWSTQGLVPPSEPGRASGVDGVTEDLTKTIVEARAPLAPGATLGRKPNYYIGDNVVGFYQLLAGPGAFSFAEATPTGSRILIEKNEGGGTQRLPFETRNLPIYNLYEWNKGQLSLVAANAVAGAGPATYEQGTISQDGSRVFFTDIATKETEVEEEKIFVVELGKIYVRENGEAIVPVSEGNAHWRAATPDGRYVFYTEEGELWRFDVDNMVHKVVAGGAAGVLGTLGVSNDGSYVYFVASSVLASGAIDGNANLYEWHEGETIFIGGLGKEKDEADWRDYVNNGEPAGPDHGGKSSRVTPNGSAILFSSSLPLTSYDNAGEFELYLFDGTLPVSLENPICVSCNPSRTPAVNPAYLWHRGATLPAPIGRNRFLTHNLSNDGNHVFFQTEEALVPQDTNDQMDVYEWERGGTESCQGRRSEGCVYLISTGHSTGESYLGDASADGSSVFFFTRQSLVSQDRDNNVDIYDARVGGGIADQNPVPAQPCAGEECRVGLGLVPVLSVPSSATFSGIGNLAQQPEVKPMKKKKSKRRKIKRKNREKRGRKAVKSARTHGIALRHRS